MGELGGFLKISRAPTPERDPRTRIRDHAEIYAVLTEPDARDQGARCMDCGVPFCHDGCPLGNRIPDWNDLVYQGRWREAIDQLHATNNFPEWTGRICPAPCEPACVLAINDDPVSIKQIELAIIERAFAEGWVVPRPPERRTGRTVAVVGSGPAGLAAAAELNRAGHLVTVYERDEGPGGLMRFGVPDAKQDKASIDRRISLMEQEGVRFVYGVDVGVDLPGEQLLAEVDAVVIATGSRVPRELEIPGRRLEGVHFAMEYLYERNRAVARELGTALPLTPPPPEHPISAAGKHVVVIGGGDTAMDCVSNAHRELAASVTVLDTYPEPIGTHARDVVPWPEQPRRLQHTYAMDEGGERRWRQSAIEIVGDDGRAQRIRGAHTGPGPDYAPVAGTEFELPAELVLIAIGFAHPEHEGLLTELGLELDRRGNVKAPAYAASRARVFAAGDARRGQSLIVWAIAEGRRCARAVEKYLAEIPAVAA